MITGAPPTPAVYPSRLHPPCSTVPSLAAAPTFAFSGSAAPDRLERCTHPRYAPKLLRELLRFGDAARLQRREVRWRRGGLVRDGDALALSGYEQAPVLDRAGRLALLERLALLHRAHVRGILFGADERATRLELRDERRLAVAEVRDLPRRAEREGLEGA